MTSAVQVADIKQIEDYLFRKDTITYKMFVRLSPELKARILPGLWRSIGAQQANSRKGLETDFHLDVHPLQEIIKDASLGKFYFEEV